MKEKTKSTDPKIEVTETGPADLTYLPRRRDDSNKGTYGKLLILAGSYNMAGAAALSARAAYRSGTGLVRVATDAANRAILQTLVPEAILATYDDKTDMEQFVWEQTDWADAVVMGPGIGQSRQAEELVRCALQELTVPCLADADALNILAHHPEWLADPAEEIIVTPHPGEMSRLLATSVSAIREDPLAAARRCTEMYGTVTVLKDAQTLIYTPDGRAWINRTGNHGMATAGSGDVLSGIIGALIGQNVEAARAAELGVLLHGMAGNAAAEKMGKTSLMASDIIDGLVEVFRAREETEESERQG